MKYSVPLCSLSSRLHVATIIVLPTQHRPRSMRLFRDAAGHQEPFQQLHQPSKSNPPASSNKVPAGTAAHSSKTRAASGVTVQIRLRGVLWHRALLDQPHTVEGNAQNQAPANCRCRPRRRLCFWRRFSCRHIGHQAAFAGEIAGGKKPLEDRAN